MTAAEAAAVRLRVVWVAGRDGGRRGRVVVQRTVTGGPGPAGFWLSGPMAAAALVGATRGGRTSAWHDLLLGLPVGELSTPVPLRPAARGDLDDLSEELAGSDAVAVVQRPLLLAAAELVGGAAVSARVVRFAGDVLAHAFDGVLEGPPPGLVLGKTTVEGTAAAAHEAGTRFAGDAWIPLADVTGARPVERRGRVTTLALEPPGAGTSPGRHGDAARAGPLAVAGVPALVIALAADPDDVTAREALVAALAAAGWSVRAGTATIDVGGRDVDGLVDLLDGLVVLAVPDPADPGAPQRVTVVGPTRAASGVLRAHSRLAAALAASFASPGAGGAGGGAAAHIARRRELRAALREAVSGAVHAPR